MRKQAITTLAVCILLIAPATAPAAGQDQQRLRATYEVYAAGIDFASAEIRFALNPSSYMLDVRYRTVGMLGVLYPGRQHNVVMGAWHGATARPHRYHGVGHWRGRDYVSLIDYEPHQPEVLTLLPASDEEREPVPEALRPGSVDTLSALAGLIAHVARTDRCDTTANLFDGRRAVQVAARSAGPEVLPRTARSSFDGKAIRCDFEARVIAGFRKSDDAAYRSRPYVGSAWFARPMANAMPVPVRITFETKALGTARMYLTGITPEGDGRTPLVPIEAAATGSRLPPSR